MRTICSSAGTADGTPVRLLLASPVALPIRGETGRLGEAPPKSREVESGGLGSSTNRWTMQAAHHRPHVNYKWIRTDRKYLETRMVA